MKIHIGPYQKWWGPYQIADLFQFFGVSEDRCFNWGERLSRTWVGDFCQYIHDLRPRTVKIRIDDFDTFNMNTTLSMIILPMLKQLRASKHGAPYVKNEDVPEYMRVDDGRYDTEVDELFFARWDWVMSEMIWGFEQLQPEVDGLEAFVIRNETPAVRFDDSYKTHLKDFLDGMTFDHKGLRLHEERVQNSMRLFGVYFQNLWD